ncbi:MAG: YitT family protein [Bacteroidota bacterium]|jgi:uncharacterized membrane-anchored protein YitT (DUF2179 family)
MNPFLVRIIKKLVLKSRQQMGATSYSSYQLAKGYKDFLVLTKHLFKDIFLITLGVYSASLGLKSFILPNSFIDGGATGMALLTSALTQIPLYILIIIINIPFIILGYKTIGKRFAIKTIFAISLLSSFVALVSFPNITNDRLLVAIFGGLFLGAGIGFSIRGGAVIDGTEVLAIFLSKKFGTTIGDVIIVINVLIFSTAAYFLGLETAMYSMITYLAASKTLDFIVEGIEEYIGVTIVAAHSEDIRQMIITVMGRGVTIYSGKRGFGKRGEEKEVDIIYTVITRLELNKLTTEIEKIEPSAFVVMNSVKDTKGGMIKKRPLKH